MVESSVLSDMLSSITAGRQNTIVIGESKYHGDVVRNFPKLSEFTWLDRPVDMDYLCKVVGDEISGRKVGGDKKRILIKRY